MRPAFGRRATGSSDDVEDLIDTLAPCVGCTVEDVYACFAACRPRHEQQRHRCARKAYSYVRFSKAAQADGDSLRRQMEAARSFAAWNNLDLDETLDLTDRGVSGQFGQNIESGRLRAFLDAVRDGTVPQGWYLLVESLGFEHHEASRHSASKAGRLSRPLAPLMP